MRGLRDGLTLIEMLVAVAVFMVGFTAVYTLFLHGMRDRALAESTVHGTLAAGAVSDRMQLFAGNETALLTYPPAAYVGDGDPDDGGAEGNNGIPDGTDEFYRHPDHPGIYYRVFRVTDLAGGVPPPDSAEVFRAEILTAQLGGGEASVDVAEIRRRFGVPPAASADDALRRLLAGANFQRHETLIHRRLRR